MTNIFIANIGEQDVWLDVGGAENSRFFAFDPRGGASEVRQYLGLSDEAGALAIAALIREPKRFDELKGRILLPILRPAIEIVLAKVQQIDRLWLIGTDQEAGEFHWRDTIESAWLIRQLLHEQFPSAIQTIEEPFPAKINPSRQEEASDFMRQFLLQQVPREADLRVFASVRGGVPALNASLRQHVANIYGGQGFLVETEEPEGGSRTGQVGRGRIITTWSLRRDAVVRLVQQALDGDNYQGALAILTSEGITDPFLVGALEHAHRRQNLDFAEAAEKLRGLPGSAQQWADSARRADTDSFQRLAEIAQTAVSCLGSGDYIGFLARLESFADNARRIACELLIGIKIRGARLSVQDLQQANQETAQRLESQFPASRGQWKVEFKLYDTLMEIGGQLTQKEEEIRGLRGQLRGLQGLATLRNAVIHELKSVSKDALDRIFPPDVSKVAIRLSIILGQLGRLNPARDRALQKNVFDLIKKEVLQSLEKLEPTQE